MTVKGALRKFYMIEADLLLARLLKKSREFLYMHPEYELSAAQSKKFNGLARSRLYGMPAAYLLGHKDFYGLRFAVSPDVLIPRPESEWLVDRALEETKKRQGRLRVLDMGTGSGCLMISMAKHMAGSKATCLASDISKKALSMAKKNAMKHKVKIKFIQSDLFQKVPGTFDIIIANLPYVPVRDYKKLKKNLRYEPKLALSDGTNTWRLYQRFFRELSGHIKPRTIILLEIDPTSVALLRAWIKRRLPGYSATFHKDLNKLWRYAVIAR